MDTMSRRIVEHTREIKNTARTLKSVFRTLDPDEVENQCWLSMWKALQKCEDLDHPLYSVYYWTVRSDMKDLMTWYSRRQKYVSFVSEDILIEQVDNPQNYLEALETVHGIRRPIKGLLQEVMDGLGIQQAYAKKKLRAAKQALGIETKGGAGRYTDDQKLAILAYLGIQIGSPVE